MMYEGISHRCGYNDCYCLNEDELRVNLHANRRVVRAVICWEDPYINGISGAYSWDGRPEEMEISRELALENIWSATLKPPYKRAQYYFLLTFDDGSSRVLLEDGLYDPSFVNRTEMARHFFKFAWMNEADICRTPRWAEDTVWYQIFPDRFNRIPDGRPGKFEDWDKPFVKSHKCLYGGNLRGVRDKLDYLQDLGITGIYFNPIFRSLSNHRYDTTDYRELDPVFGTNEEFREFIREAHDRGIRIMIDAVFNHSGPEFFAWQDVLARGRDSRYFDWYYVNDPESLKKQGNTKDGRFYSFAFVAEMPKLNTNNPEVMKYFTDISLGWVREFDIDGIRFDVGNEVSHRFIRHLREELKRVKPDIFLLGEIWTDAAPWLDGDQYDSVMNYPFMQTVGNFFTDRSLDASYFRQKINYCLSLYKEQITRELFNQLDSHDVSRIINRAGSYDVFIQEMTILMTLPGAPCLYYGTEIALEGKNDPWNRRPMPWKDIAAGKYRDVLEDIKRLIAVRRNPGFASAREAVFGGTGNEPGETAEAPGSRLIRYSRGRDGRYQVFINAGDHAEEIPVSGETLFARRYDAGRLEQGGVLVRDLGDIR